jgi:hypothetical protein
MKVATRGFYVAMRFGRSARAFMTAVPLVLRFLLDGQRYLGLHQFGERFELVVRRPVGPRALTRSVTSRADRAHTDDMSQGWAQQPQQVRGYSILPPIPLPNAHTSRPSPSFDRCCSFRDLIEYSSPPSLAFLPPGLRRSPTGARRGVLQPQRAADARV